MSHLRVLSIQSHVVYGYVGNKSATFPLQLLGFEVDAINSVQLSNHTGYRCFKGQVLEEKDISELVDGLSENDLLKMYTHLLTGYVRNDSFLLSIVQVVEKLKRCNPNLLYVCDPVLGDHGKLYVPKELVTIFRDSVIPLADIITPNQTELEFLSGIQANSLENALKGVEILHKKGCRIIVVTTMEFAETANELCVLASRSGGEKVVIEIPKLEANFFGTGDLFAAVFLAWFTKTKFNIVEALELTVGTVNGVITRTLNFYEGRSGDNCEPKALELKLIQSRADIENPKILYRSRKIE